MRRKIWSFVAAACIALSTTIAEPATAYAVGGACAGGQGSNTHIWIEKRNYDIVGASYFDDLSGYANIAPLVNCVGGAWGGSFVLPANATEGYYQGAPIKAQLGYGKRNDGVFRFIYALGDDSLNVIGSPTPNETHSFKFRIYRRTSGYVSFEIKDLNTGLFVWTYYPSSETWGTNVTKAWWAFEAANNLESSHGSLLGQEQSKIWYMSYSWEDTTNNTFRTNLACFGDPDERDNVQKNFASDGSEYPHACPSGGGTRLASILTTVYTGDTLRVWTED